MSELLNPIFDEEKEFLERKKLEYERALLGDVNEIKEKTVQVGRVALVGAGLAGGIWLISKAFGKKKRKSKAKHHEPDYDDFGSDGFTADYDSYYDDDSSAAHKSAAASAEAFMDHHEQEEGHDPSATARPFAGAVEDQNPADEQADEFEEDPFQDLPYDDSRRLPASHAFDSTETSEVQAKSSRTRMIGSVLQSFLQSDTGKVLVAQAAAVVMAMVTKKVGEFFPTDKNSDLAASPGKAPAEPGTYPVASSDSSASSDASKISHSL